jgi:PAS domain S-box-containing protein
VVLVLVSVGALFAWRRTRQALRAERSRATADRQALRDMVQHQGLMRDVLSLSGLVAFRSEPSLNSAFQLVAPGMESLSGWPAEDFVNGTRRPLDLVHPAERQRVVDQLRQLVIDAPPTVLEFRRQRRDGAVLWTSVHCALRQDSAGHVWLVGALHDIDAAKTLEQQLQQSQALYQALATRIPGAAYRCAANADWTCEFISQGVEQLTGWSQADYLASAALLREIVHVDDIERVQREMQQAFDADRSYTLEYRAVRRDGSLFWAWEQGRAERDAEGRILWLDGVVLDISRRKELELALHDANQRALDAQAAKASFLANIGHEVRTPLNAIVGFSEIVLRNELDSLQRQYVYKVRQSASALVRLFNDLLDVSKNERQPTPADATEFSLRALATAALEVQRTAAQRKGLALRLDTEPGMHDWYRGDAHGLRQVLDKLLDNAVKFTEHGAVRLQLTRQHGAVTLAVHDTGIGIGADDQQRIFEPFSQADSSSTRRYGGSGLGVTLARQLVEQMGGKLSLSSTPGQGSVFRVMVPLTDIAAPALPASARPGLASHDAPEPLDAPPPVTRGAGLASAPPWRDALHSAVDALEHGEQDAVTLPGVLQGLRDEGLVQQADQIERALADFDLDRAAEVLKTVPGPL